MFLICSHIVGSRTMLRRFVEEAAALASISLFVAMIAVWAQVIPRLCGGIGNLTKAVQRTGWGKAGWRARIARSAWTRHGQGITIAAASRRACAADDRSPS